MTKARALVSVCALAAGLIAGPAFAESGAILRGLDKRTGQAQDFIAPIGKTVRFGTLEITARTCRKAPPEDTPETWVYVDIKDRPVPRAKGEERQAKEVLSGWLFASSPALDSLEHPVYDVWAIDCKS